jgi:hypothetical protein
LQAANDSMVQNIIEVQQAQDQTNKSLQDIRLQAAQTARSIQDQIMSTSNPLILQQQINKDTAAALKALEDLTHAP